jgi:hypothetical protein
LKVKAENLPCWMIGNEIYFMLYIDLDGCLSSLKNSAGIL